MRSITVIILVMARAWDKDLTAMCKFNTKRKNNHIQKWQWSTKKNIHTRLTHLDPKLLQCDTFYDFPAEKTDILSWSFDNLHIK